MLLGFSSSKEDWKRCKQDICNESFEKGVINFNDIQFFKVNLERNACYTLCIIIQLI